jgi:ATP-binding cassette subfamily B (MDR/TAP) protein 1
MPLFSVIFGEVMNSFGLNLFDPDALSSQVAANVPKFIYLGIGAFAASFLQTYFLVYSAVRQVNRMRATYLRHVLRQDVAFFDTDGTSGSLLQGLNEDCAAVQAAIGEKLAVFSMMMSIAITGIAIGETLSALQRERADGSGVRLPPR